MKQILLILAVVSLVGCGKEAPAPTAPSSPKTSAEAKKPKLPKAVPEKLIADPIVEEAIRDGLKKFEGELTEVDLEKATRLDFRGKGLTEVPQGLAKLTQLEKLSLGDNQLTDVKGLEKLTQLTYLGIADNPDLTKAQIDELKKALPKCKIKHNATK